MIKGEVQILFFGRKKTKIQCDNLFMDEMKNYCDGVEWFHYIPCHSWRLSFYVALQVAPEAHCVTELGPLGCTANSYRPVGNPQKCCAKNNGKRYKGKNLFYNLLI